MLWPSLQSVVKYLIYVICTPQHIANKDKDFGPTQEHNSGLFEKKNSIVWKHLFIDIYIN